MFKKLLVPVDLDYPETSAKAMEVAKEAARAEGAAVTVISVQPVVIDETGNPPPDYQPKMNAFLAKHGAPGEIKGILRLGGSISAEHGIGVFRREELTRFKSPEALALMRTLKRALDPKGIMNPRVLI